MGVTRGVVDLVRWTYKGWDLTSTGTVVISPNPPGNVKFIITKIYIEIATKSGTFTSVAPQLNSTFAFTPWLAR